MLRRHAAITPGKPVASVLVTLLWLIGFVAIPSDGFHISLFGTTYFFPTAYSIPGDPAHYNIITLKWAWIIVLAVVWLMFQLFWRASSETTKLSLGVSYTLLWLALVFFFPFKDPTIESQAGAAAFFALAGGLGVVLIWTRFLADDV